MCNCKGSGWLNNSYDYCTQKKAIEELANAVNILLVSSEEIEQDALKVEEIHLASKGIRYLPSINAASPKSKRRWAVNHIRHNLTDYDIKVSDLDNLEGNPQLNYFYFKDLILTRIKKVYPQYSDECDKQIKNLWEIYHRKFGA